MCFTKIKKLENGKRNPKNVNWLSYSKILLNQMQILRTALSHRDNMN